MDGGARAFDGFDGFVMSGGFLLRALAVVGLGEDVGMFINACVIEVKSSTAANVFDDVVLEVEPESAWIEGYQGSKITTADCLAEQFTLWGVERRCSVYSEKEFYRIVKKRGSEYIMKTEV